MPHRSPVKMDFATLRFPEGTEQAYLEDYHHKSIRQIRMVLSLVLILWCAAGIKDEWIAPAEKDRLSFIRFAVFAPFGAVVTLFSFAPLFKKYGQLCLSMVLLLGGSCIVAMNVAAPALGNYLYPTALTIFLMSPSFLKLRFPYAFVDCWLTVAVYNIAALWLIHIPLGLLISYDVYFVAANVVSLVTCYFLDAYSRRDFLQQGAQRIAAAVYNNTTDGIIVTDTSGVIQSVNAAFERITGYSAAEVVGRNPRILNSGMQEADFYAGMWKALLETGTWKGKFWNRRKNGEIYPQETTLNAIKDDRGDIVQFSGIMRDVTEQNSLEETLRTLSATDSLTGLSNRRSFDEAITREWRRAQRLGYPMALIMADIDYFKNFNDTYGHVKGDECLKQVAAVLKNAVRRAGDLAARYGGEEFAVILPMTDSGEVVQIAENIRKGVEALDIPHRSSDAEPRVTLSMGVVSVIPLKQMPANDLIALADKALYEAKKQGRNRVVSAA